MPLMYQQTGATVVLMPAGRIDHASADGFRDAVAPWFDGCHDQAGGHALVFDFSGVDYISSAGLRVLMLASKQTKPVGGRVAVAALQPIVAEIFKISRFDLVFALHATVAAAVASFADQHAGAGQQAGGTTNSAGDAPGNTR